MYYMTQRHYVKCWQVGQVSDNSMPSFCNEFIKQGRAKDGDWIVLDENEEVNVYTNEKFIELYEAVQHG